MKISANNLWKTIVDQLAENDEKSTVHTWLQPARVREFSGNILSIEVPNKLFSDRIAVHYKQKIEQTAAIFIGKPVELHISIRENKKTEAGKSRIASLRKRAPFSRRKLFAADFQLNDKYVFDSFIVGPSNRFAHAACIAVAQSPAKAYNPLFIYGGVGLGKTHLMQAIGHHIIDRYPDANVIYISSEKFTNQLIDAIQNRTTIKFRNKYRNVDVLLIDDIHFLGGKEQTQEEFFHTFNTLYDAHKQIVLSSDRPPKEIPNLEDRLVSRFEWGLVTDLQPPDVETRIAILRKKAEQEEIDLPDDVVFYIASRIKSNVRKLEGALSRLTAYTTLMDVPLSIEVAEDILADLTTSEEHKIITIEDIQKRIAEYFDIRVSDMMSKKRPHSIAYPRQVAMYLSRKIVEASLPEIGEAFGGRDHTTVMHAIKMIEKRLEKDEGLGKILEMLERQIRA